MNVNTNNILALVGKGQQKHVQEDITSFGLAVVQSGFTYNMKVHYEHGVVVIIKIKSGIHTSESCQRKKHLVRFCTNRSIVKRNRFPKPMMENRVEDGWMDG